MLVFVEEKRVSIFLKEGMFLVKFLVQQVALVSRIKSKIKKLNLGSKITCFQTWDLWIRPDQLEDSIFPNPNVTSEEHKQGLDKVKNMKKNIEPILMKANAALHRYYTLAVCTHLRIGCSIAQVSEARHFTTVWWEHLKMHPTWKLYCTLWADTTTSEPKEL